MQKRKELRLRDYDYAKEGAYFVTICAYKNVDLFGEVINGQMNENTYGRMVREEWLRTAIVRSNVVLDAFVIMPNHLHGIIQIERASRRLARTVASGTLGAIIGQFKSIVTKRINETQKNGKCVVWQRGFYDHIIRKDGDLNRVREYILNNPLQWHINGRGEPMARP